MSDSAKKPPTSVDALIDQNLKRVFSSLEDEPVPERFQELLAKLRARDDRTSSEE